MNVKIFSMRLSVAVLTFMIGVAAVLGWFYYSYHPKVKVIETTIACDFPDYANRQISKSDKLFWNKEILGRFAEQPLENIPATLDESYRFTLIPTFDAPVSIRIWRANNRYFLTAKKLSGKGGFGIEKFGRLSSEKTRELDADEWFKFTSLIDNSWFWSEPSLTREGVFCDGAEWIMEGVIQERGRGKNYHEIHRIDPKPEFQETCDYLLKLSGFKTEH